MGAQYVITTGLTALTAATAKTMVEVFPGANVPVTLKQLGVSSSYLTAGTPITCLVEIGTVTATGTGTGATANKWGIGAGAIAATCKVNDTVEPSGFSAIYGVELVFPAGPWEPIQFPLGSEPVFAISTKYAIRLTASAAASVIVNAVLEE